MTGVDGTVNRKKAKYHKIVRHNLRGIIESRHVLCGVLCTPQIEATAKYRRLYQRTIESLPI